jgi:hypothetical protein
MKCGVLGSGGHHTSATQYILFDNLINLFTNTLLTLPLF